MYLPQQHLGKKRLWRLTTTTNPDKPGRKIPQEKFSFLIRLVRSEPKFPEQNFPLAKLGPQHALLSIGSNISTPHRATVGKISVTLWNKIDNLAWWEWQAKSYEKTRKTKVLVEPQIQDLGLLVWGVQRMNLVGPHPTRPVQLFCPQSRRYRLSLTKECCIICSKTLHCCAVSEPIPWSWGF